jgi:hypothetical protein
VFKPINSFLLCALLLTLSSCRKQEDLNPVITGRVVDKSFGLPMEGAKVLFQVNEWIDNEEVILTVEEIETDSDGRFSFNRSTGYEFVNAEMEGYYFRERDRQTTSEVNHIDIELVGRAWLDIHVVNTGTSDPTDMVSLRPRFENEHPIAHTFYGDTINEHLFGEIRANYVHRVSWLTFITNHYEWNHMEISSAPNDTISLYIAY